MNGYVQIQIVADLVLPHRIGEDFYVFRETIGQDAAEYHHPIGESNTRTHRIDRQLLLCCPSICSMGNNFDALPSGYLDTSSS